MAEAVRGLWVGREAVEGTLAARLFNIPFLTADTVFLQGIDIPEEYIAGSRVREEAGTLVDKHSEITIKAKLTYDLFPIFLCSALNAPVRTTHAGGTPASNVVTLTFLNSPTGGTFTVTIGGYSTPAQAFNVATATLQTAIQALPSVGSGNCTVTGTAGTNYILTFASGLVNVNMFPVMSADGTLLTGATVQPSTVLTNTTPGVGAYDYNSKIGSGVPTLSIIFFDGVAYRQYLGCSVDSLKFSFMQNKSPEVDIKLIGRGETTYAVGSPPVVPTLARYAYSKVAAQDLAITINGVSFTALLTGTIDLKLDRKPLNTIQPGLDMIRAPEGRIEADFELNALFTAQVGSLYAAFVANTPIGSLGIAAQRTTTTILAAGVYPTFQLTALNPIVKTGDIKAMGQNYTSQDIKGRLGLDIGTATNIAALVTNEIFDYQGT